MNYIKPIYLIITAIFAFLVMASPNCFSQNTVKQLSNIDGLSNNSVNCIFEDSQHNLWIGTWDGLNSYNGRDFKTYRYNRNNKASISNNVIRQIVETDSTTLWIATDYGVNKWDSKMQVFTNYFLGTEQQIPKQEKSYMIGVTSQKDVICFVKQQGLFYFDKKQQAFVSIRTSFAEKEIKDLVVDDKDNIYFLFDNGTLAQYKLVSRAGKIDIVSPQYIGQENPISSMFLSENILILNCTSYLKLIDNKNRYPSSINIDKNKTISKVIYHNGFLLISYYEGGYLKYDLETKTYDPIEDSFSKTSVFSLFLGSQDILWIGTDGQGLYKMYDHNSPFNTVPTAHPVRSFCESLPNQILVGTKGDGIKIFEKKIGYLSDFLNTSNGLISNSVYTIKKNNSGDVFIGTEGAGINILYTKNKRLEKLNIPSIYPNFKAVYSILFTHNDSLLWLGTSGYGLIKISLTKKNETYSVRDVEQYTSSDRHKALNNNIIYSLVDIDNKNELWLGTRGGGISKFDIDAKTFQPLDTVAMLTSYDILSLMKDKSGLWIGTSYGLNRLSTTSSPIQIKEFTNNEGLADNTIHGILEDGKNNIWVSTNRGISHIKTSDNTIVNYSLKDGLQNDEFSDGAYYKDASGLLYLGGVSGFNYFRPEEIRLRDFNPSIELSNVRIFNSSQNVSERIKNNVLSLSYDEAYVSFTFIARDFINNENCEYDYRLLNFSDEWINNGNNPNIAFTRLPPGNYELEVKCTNGDKVWGSNLFSLHIQVGYPWWLSMGAFVVYALLIIAVAYTAYSVVRNRIRLNKQLLLEHIEKQNQQTIHESKLNFFTNVAHEFFTPLTLIYGPAQHLLEKKELDAYTKRYIQIIKNNADRMQKLINELMEFRKVESGHAPLYPESVDVKFLMDYVSDNYSEIAQENKIDFRIETDNLSHIVSDRNSLEKIIFNLISNAFKYTPNNGYIHLTIWQDDRLHLTIRNSGRGLSEKQMTEIFNQFKIFGTSNLHKSTSTGIGLGLTKSLTEMLCGTITVSSQLGEYVEFQLQIPPMEHTDVAVENNKTDDANIVYVTGGILNKKNVSILIVEDEKNIRELLKDILSEYYNVSEAEDGLEGLSMIKQNMPDIIISDILMPKMDGIGLIDNLKSNPQTRHIPVINISAKILVEDHINAYEHGADLYIVKPFHPRQVLITVENLIKKHSILKEYYNSSRSAITIKDGMPIHQDDERFLQEIISCIELNIDDESLNPTSLSESMGLSKATLYRKLKDLADKTPSEFVRSIRLGYASQLLTTSKMTVSEIMFKSGFTNKSYFYREFGKQFGLSPKEYRDSKKE